MYKCYGFPFRKYFPFGNYIRFIYLTLTPLLGPQSSFLSLPHIVRKKPRINDTPACQVRMRAISDAMDILSGKWKFHILGTLIEGSTLGFMDLMREIDGIGTKMLSKELQDLEMNQLVQRRVLDTKPVTVEYSLTEHGRTLAPLISALASWGTEYRASVVSDTGLVV